MKKLTAGIFTALLGLVTVNAANAAIPSTNYVNEHIDAVRYEYKLADTALGTRIDGVETAYKAADSALDGRVTGLETTVGEGTMVVATETQADVIAAINALDAKTNGIATNENLEKLQQTVTEHTNSLNVLNGTGEGSVAKAETDAVATAKAYTDQLANGQVKTNTDAIATNAAAIAGLGEVYDAKGAAAAAQEAAEAAAATYTDGQIAGLAATYETKANVSTAVQEAKGYADNAASQAETTAKSYADGLASNYDAAGAAATAQTNAIASAKTYADTELAKKVDKAQGAGAANQVLITDGTGTVTTSATITQTQVTNLTTDLAAKMTDVTAVSEAGQEDGVYVLTAKVVGEETTYKWELIQRDVTE